MGTMSESRLSCLVRGLMTSLFSRSLSQRRQNGKSVNPEQPTLDETYFRPVMAIHGQSCTEVDFPHILIGAIESPR